MIGTIFGAILGWGLALLQNLVTERRKAVRDLRAALELCLTTVQQLKQQLEGVGSTAEPATLQSLQQDLLHYRTTVANYPKKRSELWALFKQMTSLSREPDKRSAQNIEQTLVTKLSEL